LCLQAVEIQPRFRFRPFLNDPKDDLFIECALTANARTIVTTDNHFKHPAVAGFGLKTVSAKEYVRELRKKGG
jgi:predicted nucleic acid-binding protein